MRPPTQTHRPREGHGVHSILTSGIQTLALSIIVCAIIWKHARTFQATPPAVSNDPVDDALPPDLVRLGKPVPSEALKCGVAIPPESIVTTRHGQFSVVVFGRAWSLGSVDGRQFAWSYEVELANEGSDSIQLMTRHMVVTHPDGTVEETKGAGTGGRLPVLAPGERYKVTGTALLHTSHGSMHGSYQFEQLAASGEPGEAFSANLGRLALTSSGRSELVACSPEADLMSRVLPTTSVYNSYRVMIGATSEYAPERSEAELSRHAFTYHVEVINGRQRPIVIHGRQWTFLDANGVARTESGAGVGGVKGLGRLRLQPGQALNYQGAFELPTTTGIAAARFMVALDEDDPDRATYEVLLAPMGVSADGRPVPPIEHNAFLSDLQQGR